MNKEKKKISTLMLIWIFIMGFIIAFLIGIDYSDNIISEFQNFSNQEVVGGIWFTDYTYNFICIDVHNRNIEDIQKTIFHEIGHEIYYRNNKNYSNLSGSETFAIKCEGDWEWCIRNTMKEGKWQI